MSCSTRSSLVNISIQQHVNPTLLLGTDKTAGCAKHRVHENAADDGVHDHFARMLVKGRDDLDPLRTVVYLRNAKHVSEHGASSRDVSRIRRVVRPIELYN